MRGQRHPPKCKQNITGLKNQSEPSPSPKDWSNSPEKQPEVETDDEDNIHDVPDDVIDECWVGEEATGLTWWFGYEDEGMDEDIEEMVGWDDEELGLEDSDLSKKLSCYAAAMGDDS